jgi:hypothetical protein
MASITRRRYAGGEDQRYGNRHHRFDSTWGTAVFVHGSSTEPKNLKVSMNLIAEKLVHVCYPPLTTAPYHCGDLLVVTSAKSRRCLNPATVFS